MKKPVIHRAILASTILGLSLAGITACSSAETPPAEQTIVTDSQTSPAAAATSGTPAVPSQAVPSLDPMLVAAQKRNAPAREESIKLLKADGIVVTDKLVSTPKGNFPKLEVTKDSEYAKFTEAKHTGGLPQGWTKRDANEAQRFGLNYSLQEVWDSSMTGTGDVSDEESDSWKDRNANTFYPEVKAEFMAKEASELVFTPEWLEYDEFLAAEYSYPFDEITPRIRSVQLSKVESQEYRGGLFVRFAGVITMNASTKENPKIVEALEVEMSTSVVKQDGEYFIAGAQHHYSADSDTLYASLKPKK